MSPIQFAEQNWVDYWPYIKPFLNETDAVRLAYDANTSFQDEVDLHMQGQFMQLRDMALTNLKSYQSLHVGDAVGSGIKFGVDTVKDIAQGNLNTLSILNNFVSNLSDAVQLAPGVPDYGISCTRGNCSFVEY